MFIPLTYALVAIRFIILLNKPGFALWQTIMVLMLMDVIAIIAGYFIFNWLEKKTRKAGTISMH